MDNNVNNLNEQTEENEINVANTNSQEDNSTGIFKIANETMTKPLETISKVKKADPNLLVITLAILVALIIFGMFGMFAIAVL